MATIQPHSEYLTHHTYYTLLTFTSHHTSHLLTKTTPISPTYINSANNQLTPLYLFLYTYIAKPLLPIPSHLLTNLPHFTYQIPATHLLSYLWFNSIPFYLLSIPHLLHPAYLFNPTYPILPTNKRCYQRLHFTPIILPFLPHLLTPT